VSPLWEWLPATILSRQDAAPTGKGFNFIGSPTPALRFIALSLRRTTRTPRDTRLARLEFGAFYKVVGKSFFYESINFEKI
jgi:hypothetical protein